jgi:hypothetical protein
MRGENNPCFGRVGDKNPRFGVEGYWKGKLGGRAKKVV